MNKIVPTECGCSASNEISRAIEAMCRRSSSYISEVSNERAAAATDAPLLGALTTAGK